MFSKVGTHPSTGAAITVSIGSSTFITLYPREVRIVEISRYGKYEIAQLTADQLYGK